MPDHNRRAQSASKKRKKAQNALHVAPTTDSFASLIVSAIRERAVLRFVYDGKHRLVEPQTYGISVGGNPVLRAHQIGGGSRAGQTRIAKLFAQHKISELERTGAHFSGALPEHNPRDSAMVEIIASLPRPTQTRACIARSVQRDGGLAELKVQPGNSFARAARDRLRERITRHTISFRGIARGIE